MVPKGPLGAGRGWAGHNPSLILAKGSYQVVDLSFVPISERRTAEVKRKGDEPKGPQRKTANRRHSATATSPSTGHRRKGYAYHEKELVLAILLVTRETDPNIQYVRQVS